MNRARQCGFLALIAAPLCFAGEDDRSNTQHLGVKARPISQSAPSYPSRESRHGRQGWVQLSYVVSVDGTVIEPVVEDSSGSESFERAALDAVRQWSFEPATWDGKPVQQCHTDIMVAFAFEGEETGVSSKFFRRYRRAEKAIHAGNLSKAQNIIDGIMKDYSLTLGETAWLWALRANLASQVGDKGAQLTALRKAIGNDGKWLDDRLYPNLLFVKTAIEFENGEYSSALRSHRKLIKTRFEHPQLHLLDPYVDAVHDFLQSDKTLSVPASISATKWYYRPLRRKFRIADINGELGNIEFRCDWQRIVDGAVEGTTWDLPENWGDCSVFVFGEPGSTFKFMELPDA